MGMMDEFEHLSMVAKIGGAAIAFKEEFEKAESDFEKLMIAKILVEHMRQIEREADASRNRDQVHD